MHEKIVFLAQCYFLDQCKEEEKYEENRAIFRNIISKTAKLTFGMIVVYMENV